MLKSLSIVGLVCPLSLFISLTASQGLAPTGHSIPTTVQPVNGSQVTVGCTGTQPSPFACINLDPTTAGGATSYLVDGNIPAPLDFSDTNWARELMTVNHNGGDFQIRINFNSANAARMELVLFNCPDLGIGAMDITVETGLSSQLELLGNFTLRNTSCDSLLTVCVPLVTSVGPANTYRINFLNDSTSDIDWTHIAEVTFYEDSVECADPFPVTPAPTEPTGFSSVSTFTVPLPTPETTKGPSQIPVASLSIAAILVSGLTAVTVIAVALIFSIAKCRKPHHNNQQPVYDITQATPNIAYGRTTELTELPESQAVRPPTYEQID